MGLKKWLQQLQPAPLYLMLVLSLTHFLAQMVICHVTHSLTILVDSCHMLCNIIALVGCIMTLKYESSSSNMKPFKTTSDNSKNSEKNPESELPNKITNEKSMSIIHDEKELRNTFGWARGEVLMMLVVCIFFLSLSYSVFVEALQTLIHINHKQSLRYPLIVLIMGLVGLFLNGFCYLLIGGFTYHQGSFLHITKSGEVILDSIATVDSVRQGQRRLSHLRRSTIPRPQLKEREGFGEITRDITSCLFVIISGLAVYYTDIHVGKYIDPILTIVSAATLLALTFPYLVESGLILLQTIPATMNIEALHADLLKSFPNVINIHDFHVWQLTTRKVVLTMHIIFSNPMDYVKQSEEVIAFLLKQGITEVTIQPEFQSANVSSVSSSKNECLMRCKGKGCDTKYCCNTNMSVDELPTVVISDKNENDININQENKDNNSSSEIQDVEIK